MLNSIQTESLSKTFGNLNAVDNISFEVGDSEIFGFLGSNGAGKSTTMMILTTLLRPTSGRALIAGYDVTTQAKKVRENIGYVQQDTAADEYMTGRENLLLQAKLNHVDKKLINSRIDDILELIDLVDKQDDTVLTYSGGMKKRLDIAGGLLHRPRVLFLDEPTVGLDIHTRRKIWKYIKDVHKEYKMSVFLSTHYMEEADQLCDRVGIIDHGQIQTIDTPKSIKSALGQEIVHITTNSEPQMLASRIKTLEDIKNIKIQDENIAVFTADGAHIIPKIFQIAMASAIEITSISLTRPTLDDVFLYYTGHKLQDGHNSNPPRPGPQIKGLRT